MQLLSKSLRQKVGTITHFYSMLSSVAWFGCRKKMQLLGKLQYLGVAVATSGLPSVYMALGSFKNGHNFSCVSNFSYLYSYVLFNSDIFLLSACNTLFKNQCLDLKRHTQLFSGAEIFFFCNYILKYSFLLFV